MLHCVALCCWSPALLDKNRINTYMQMYRAKENGTDVGHLWGAIAYRLEGRTLNRENPVSNPTAVASNLWQV